MHIKDINSNNLVYNYFDNLIKVVKIETKNKLIDDKNCNDLVIYFVRYVRKTSIDILRLYYHD